MKKFSILITAVFILGSFSLFGDGSQEEQVKTKLPAKSIVVLEISKL